MKWPDAHVAWEAVLDAAPHLGMPFATHVFVFHTAEQLRAACGDPDAGAFSSTFDEVDDAGVGALVMLSREHLALSLVAHEATHVALFHHRESAGRIGARRWLNEHPESVADMAGNLTAVIWHSLPFHDEGPDE